MTPREFVLWLLVKLEDNDGYSNILLDKELSRQDFTEQESSFASALFYGVIERKLTLDFYISKLSKIRIKKLDTDVLMILRMGIYQIMYMNSVPDSAAVNESVKLSKKNKRARTSGFVNGILRSFIRERQSIKLPTEKTERLSVLYSCPKWLVKKLNDEYGEQNAIDFLESSLNPSEVVLKTNTIRTSTDDLIKSLSDEGVKASPCEFDNNAIKVKGNVFKTSAYKQGLFHAQDYSSQYAVKALDPKPYERVLDICSAPGGKAFTAAEIMQNKGELVACELYEQRAALIKNGAERLGLDIIDVKVNDALKFNSELGVFDRALCDVPCSGLGVIKRKPEIKYKSPQSIDELPPVQLEILKVTSGYVKRGGRLIYSTCTLNKAENEEVVLKFLEQNPEISADRIFDGEASKTIFPRDFGSDGFFISVLKRTD
ncbi:MAG: 16S rRNA (cytosine(967)-C(5))-methyltransferase RsmB [Ruminococcus sp.]|nr:16S rRNA (cytosine(967)-C(5))-methyltransferase RsmB [Ruminococcus sp.]